MAISKKIPDPGSMQLVWPFINSSSWVIILSASWLLLYFNFQKYLLIPIVLLLSKSRALHETMTLGKYSYFLINFWRKPYFCLFHLLRKVSNWGDYTCMLNCCTNSKHHSQVSGVLHCLWNGWFAGEAAEGSVTMRGWFRWGRQPHRLFLLGESCKFLCLGSHSLLCFALGAELEVWSLSST